MAEKQYRVKPAKGVDVGNMREEASMDAEVVVALRRDQVVSDDPERTPNGLWRPVKFRGWMHESILAVIDV